MNVTFQPDTTTKELALPMIMQSRRHDECDDEGTCLECGEPHAREPILGGGQ